MTTPSKSLGLKENLIIQSGTLTMTNGASIGTTGVLTLNGSIAGAGAIAVFGTFNWSAIGDSIINNGSKITIQATGVFNKTGNGLLRRSIDNLGTIYVSKDWQCNSCTVNNMNLFVWSNVAGNYRLYGTSPTVNFLSSGTLRKIGGGAGSIDCPCQISGDVSVEAGTLHIGPGSHTATFQITDPLAQLEFGGGAMLAKTASVSGTGSVSVKNSNPPVAFTSDAPIDIDGNLTCDSAQSDFNAPVSVRGHLQLGVAGVSNPPTTTFADSVSLLPTGDISTDDDSTTYFNGPVDDVAGIINSGSILNFSHDVHITRSFDLHGPDLHFTGGTGIIVLPGGSLTRTGGTKLYAPIQNDGFLDLGHTSLTLMPGVSILNNGQMMFTVNSSTATYSITGDTNATAPTPIINNGTFTKLGPGTLQIGVYNALAPVNFTNNGDIQCPTGGLLFRNTFDNFGRLSSQASTTLSIFTPASFPVGSLVQAAGRIDFSVADTLDLLGDTQITGDLHVTHGNLVLHQPITPSSPVYVTGTLTTDVDQFWPAGINLQGGTLTGRGTVLLGGQSIYRGAMTGTGTTIIDKDATVTTPWAQSIPSPTLARTLENNGVIQLATTQTFKLQGATLVNNGTILIVNSSSYHNIQIISDVGTNIVQNNGVIRHAGPESFEMLAASKDPFLFNDGSLIAESGTMKLSCVTSGTGRIQVAPPATLTINGSVKAASCIVDGTTSFLPASRLDLSSQYVQSASALLKAQMSPPFQAFLVSEGFVALDGAINLQLTSNLRSAEIIPLIHSETSPIETKFSSVTLSPQGKLLYDAHNVSWNAYILGDATGDNAINIDDLTMIILNWGVCPVSPTGCDGDLNADGSIDVDDLTIVIANWNL